MIFVNLIFTSESVSAQTYCDFPTPPQGIEIAYVGSDFGLPTLTDAIAYHEMDSKPVSPNTWEPQWIFVGGSFTFDEQFGYSTYELPDSKIFMGEGAQILIVDSEMAVRLIDSEIRGCDYLWRRILVRNAVLHLEGMEIRDGYHAIELQENAWFSVSGSQFVDNYIGIYGGTTNLDIKGNFITTNLDAFQVLATEFKGEEELLLPFGGANLLADIAYAGIWMDNVQYLTIGGQSTFETGYTIFENLFYGVHLFRTNAFVSRCQFFDIYKLDQEVLSGTAGIWARGDHQFNFLLDVQGMGKYGDLVFEHCYNGVVTDFYNFRIKDVNSDRMYLAISLSNSAFKTISIQNNTFIAHRFGIANNPGSQLPDMISNLTIKNNNIVIREFVADYGTQTYTTTSRCGISLFNVFKQQQDLVIRDNVIRTDLLASGIFLSVAYGVLAYGNSIQLTSSGLNDRGIFAQSLHLSKIDHNSIYGSAIGNQWGVGVLFGQGTEYVCNSTDSLGTGFLFVANCDNSYFSTNLIGTHDIGLDLRYAGLNFTRIGAQPNKMNQWTANGNYGVAGAKHYSNDEYETTASLFDVHSNTNEYFPDPLIDPSGTWFDIAGSAGDDCRLPPTQGDWRSMEALTSIDSMILQGDTSLYTGGAYWSLRHSLFWKLFHNADLRLSSQLAEDWYDHADQSAISQLISAEDLLTTSLSGMDSVIMEELYERTIAYFPILHRLSQLDSLMWDDPHVNWELERDSLVGVWRSMNVLDSLSWDETVIRIDSIKIQVGGMLDELSTTLDIEQRWEFVLSLYLDFLTDSLDAWDSLSRVELVQIADMCIGDGGPATPWARNMVQLFDPQFFDDDVLCVETSPLFQGQRLDNGHELAVSIYPNPVVDAVFMEGHCSDGLFILTNYLGQRVFQFNVQVSQCQTYIPGLNVLPAGSYNWRFQSNEGNYATGVLLRN